MLPFLILAAIAGGCAAVLLIDAYLAAEIVPDEPFPPENDAYLEAMVRRALHSEEGIYYGRAGDAVSHSIGKARKARHDHA